jgi:hypothetical protein
MKFLYATVTLKELKPGGPAQSKLQAQIFTCNRDCDHSLKKKKLQSQSSSCLSMNYQTSSS